MTIIQLADPEVFAGAPCTTGDPERFFIDGRGDLETYQREHAKSECRRCPVRDECLKLAMKAEGQSPGEHRYGIFGGLDRHERARLARAES